MTDLVNSGFTQQRSNYRIGMDLAPKSALNQHPTCHDLVIVASNSFHILIGFILTLC